jgi:hypothetical protein
MERSGSNYTNYVMFLHPDLKVVNYPTPGEVKPGMGYKDIAKLHKYPMVMPAFIKDTEELYEWHKEQEEKKDFKGVCFKYDRGEEWYKDVLGSLNQPVLFIYCIRPIIDLVDSWKYRYGAQYTDENFVGPFKRSVNGALVLKKDPNVFYACMNVAESMAMIRRRFRYIHDKIGLKMGAMQKLFLKERRVIGERVFEREESEEELLDRFRGIGSNLDSLVSSYNLLLEEVRGK